MSSMAQGNMIYEGKKRLRAQMREHLKSTTTDQLQQFSAAICSHIACSKDLLSSTNTIAIFAAHSKEIDLSELHESLPDMRFVYPFCHKDKILSFHTVTSPTKLILGSYGILEPKLSEHSEVDTADVDLFLCPGLAFAINGARLGHGGGYYDRALATKSSRAMVWGVGMNMQIVDHITCEKHDQLMQGVITESGVMAARHD